MLSIDMILLPPLNRLMQSIIVPSELMFMLCSHTEVQIFNISSFMKAADRLFKLNIHIVFWKGT